MSKINIGLTAGIVVLLTIIFLWSRNNATILIAMGLLMVLVVVLWERFSFANTSKIASSYSYKQYLGERLRSKSLHLKLQVVIFILGIVFLVAGFF